MNRIKIDLERTAGRIDRNIFGGFVEHLGRCIYRGVYDPGSSLSNAQGFRTDVLDALRRLHLSVIRYPGGNFVSGYRWLDGVGPLEDRPARLELAWGDVESNHFGTNEFVDFCRTVNAEPLMVVNCGDGDMREARDWVEYCNGTQNTALVKLRHKHGFEQPHRVKYWGIGNEVDGNWQIGFKTPLEYARAYLEFAKVMKWVDPTIQLMACGTSYWEGQLVERVQLLLEQAGQFIDYLSMHWYIGNRTNNFSEYMAFSELIEDRLSAYEGLIQALRLQQNIKHPISIAVDEWNVWYRTFDSSGESTKGLEEVYNLEDALLTGIQLNAFIRHARTVKMANLAQLVNAIAPIVTRPDSLLLQTIFYPFELYSRTCGSVALDIFWAGETFSTEAYSGIRVLDVAATLNESENQLTVYVVNRCETDSMPTTITLDSGQFRGSVQVYTVNGPHIKAENSFSQPEQVVTSEAALTAQGNSFTYAFEPHSVTALVFAL